MPLGGYGPTPSRVPILNCPDNKTIADVIGNKEDDEFGDSLYAHAYTVNAHIHTAQKVYPSLADSIQINTHANAWMLGNLTEIIPANVVAFPFDIHWIAISDISANGEYELVLYAGTTEIGRAVFTRTDKKDVNDGMPFLCVVLPANTQIQARLASDSGGDNAKIKVYYHCY